jgi:predicted acylesterase/phospholipase RssA
VASDDREKETLASSGKEVGQLPLANYMAISGGGDSGVFGAGLLVGWTARGDRPIFKAVTGVSAGALIAPFAFLGAKYDAVLKQVSTSISQRSIFRAHNILVALSGEAYADDRPLASIIAKLVTRGLLSEIAREYAHGRLLLIGTTNLDAGQPVVWNMGEIASSHDPGALVLFQKVLLASAAIPGVFPPVMIDVEVDGKHYQEMHVDGGVVNQVFFAPPQLVQSLNLATDTYLRDRHLYVIRNGRIESEGSAVTRRTARVARRALRTLIDLQGLNDLYRLESIAQCENEQFRVAYIENAFKYPHPTAFESDFMTHLFEYSYDLAVHGNPWHEQLPGNPNPFEIREFRCLGPNSCNAAK